MISRWFRTGVALPMILFIPLLIGVGGCASAPPPKSSDDQKIEQDSVKGMQQLQQEENRQRGNEY